jgi:hypothetical protein
MKHRRLFLSVIIYKSLFQNFLRETEENLWNFRLGFSLIGTRNKLPLRKRSGFGIRLMSKSQLISFNRRRKLSQTSKTCLHLLYFEDGESSCQDRRICVLHNPIFCFTSFSLLNKVTNKFCCNGIIYLILLHFPHSYIPCVSPWHFSFSCPLSYF